MVRKLRPDEVQFTLECHPEDVAIEGNASAIDDETDAATEEWIRTELASGNEWAWCMAMVRAQWKEFEGRDTLGCCSYRSEADFRQPGGYFDDMKQAALADLNDTIAQVAETLETLN